MLSYLNEGYYKQYCIKVIDNNLYCYIPDINEVPLYSEMRKSKVVPHLVCSDIYVTIAERNYIRHL